LEEASRETETDWNELETGRDFEKDRRKEKSE
jgi:hypothetical protein